MVCFSLENLKLVFYRDSIIIIIVKLIEILYYRPAKIKKNIATMIIPLAAKLSNIIGIFTHLKLEDFSSCELKL